jgi:putative tricarboxylic transport membrane protein
MLSGALFSIISGILFLLIPSQIVTMEKSSINAQTVPKIALGGMFIFSVLLLLQGIFFKPKQEIVFDQELYASRGFKDAIRTAIYIGIIIVYMVLFKVLGFIGSSIYLIFAILIYYGARQKSYYIIALTTSALVYLIFAVGLHISLP